MLDADSFVVLLAVLTFSCVFAVSPNVPTCSKFLFYFISHTEVMLGIWCLGVCWFAVTLGSALILASL